jgi:nucleotide-binding universal stress UspA family protein
MLPPRILVATDGSPAAKAAEAYAAEMAVAQRASTIVVVTVVRDYPTRGEIVNVTPPEEDAAVALVKEAALHVLEVMGTDAIKIEEKVLESANEAAAIIAEAHMEGTCSHIVMGHRGHGGFTTLLLGSTSHHVIQGAHCPVTIIRD